MLLSVMPALCCRKHRLAEWEPCLDTKALQPADPSDVFQPIGRPYQNRSKTPPSLSGWFISGTRSASDSSRTSPVFFHLSQKLNTPRARRANGPRLMGLLKLRGTHRRKTLGFCLPLFTLFVQLFLTQSSTPSSTKPPPLS